SECNQSASNARTLTLCKQKKFCNGVSDITHQEYSMLQTYFKWGMTTVIFFLVIFSHGIAMTIQTDQIKNVVENFQEKYLQQFSVTIFGSTSTVESKVTFH
ncbi:unnamed protein product, partial [Allacma fusca]